MFPKCYSCVTISDVATIVSVQRTDKGVVVCLLLRPNETSRELQSFARPRKRSVTKVLPASLTTLQTVLSDALASPPTSLPASPSGSPPSRPEDIELDRRRAILDQEFRTQQRGVALDDPIDTFIATVRRNLPKSPQGRLFGASVGAASRALASLLRLPAPTVSATMAGLQGVTTQLVHFQLGVPQLSTPVIGEAIRGALRQDLLTALGNRDVGTLMSARDILEATPQISPSGRNLAKNLDKIALDFITRLEPD